MARQLCNVAGSALRHKPGLIAKIERAEAIPNLEAILHASDGIMVARGDLAVEVGNATVPALQKQMIRMARAADKVVITATQMMESMIVNPVPTRAEVSDVANAVLDGTDAVMLSAETAAGRYPLETVEEMAKICLEAEKASGHEIDADFSGKAFSRIDQSIAMGALFTAQHLGAKAIVALTDSGSTALWMSRHDIRTPIYALTPKLSTQRKMALYRNVRPLLMDTSADRDTALELAEGHLLRRSIGQSGDAIPYLAKHHRINHNLVAVRFQPFESLRRSLRLGLLADDIRVCEEGHSSKRIGGFKEVRSLRSGSTHQSFTGQLRSTSISRSLGSVSVTSATRTRYSP
jgi:pyruvate kinase